MKMKLLLVSIVISHTLFPLTNARLCLSGSSICRKDCCGYSYWQKCADSCVGTSCSSDDDCGKAQCNLRHRRCEIFLHTVGPGTARPTHSWVWKRCQSDNDCQCTRCYCHYGLCNKINRTPASTPLRLTPRRTTASSLRRTTASSSSSSSSTSATVRGILISCSAGIFVAAMYIIYRVCSCCKRSGSDRNVDDSVRTARTSVIHREQFLSDSLRVSELDRDPWATPVAIPTQNAVHSNHNLSEIVVGFSTSNENGDLPPPYSIYQERPRTPPPSYESVVNSR